MLKVLLAGLMLASVSVFAQDFDLGRPGDGRGGDDFDLNPGNGPYVVVCESNHRESNYCEVDGRIRDVRLRRQLSRADCIQGETWGFDRRGIHVNRGCRAEFLVFGTRRGGGDDGQGGGLSQRVRCESDNFNFEECPTQGRIVEVRLERQISNTNCVEGRNWGYDRRSIWVDRGCAAVFRAYFR